ncbi:MAG: hypothetical protein RQ899_15500, partial [Pseudomonadales bacterium]|nr:hypothetical protein [Pseudomonadales bacterium]
MGDRIKPESVIGMGQNMQPWTGSIKRSAPGNPVALEGSAFTILEKINVAHNKSIVFFMTNDPF